MTIQLRKIISKIWFMHIVFILFSNSQLSRYNIEKVAEWNYDTYGTASCIEYITPTDDITVRLLHSDLTKSTVNPQLHRQKLIRLIVYSLGNDFFSGHRVWDNCAQLVQCMCGERRHPLLALGEYDGICDVIPAHLRPLCSRRRSNGALNELCRRSLDCPKEPVFSTKKAVGLRPRLVVDLTYGIRFETFNVFRSWFYRPAISADRSSRARHTRWREG